MTRPEATVRSIYQYFGMALSSQYQAQLTKDSTAAKFYKSSHTYAVEDYGFSSDEIERYMLGHSSKHEVLASAQAAPLN